MPSEPLREILLRMTARYVTVTPRGLRVEEVLVPAVTARVINFGGARTLYRGRKPHCRSLDGVAAINGTQCASCPELRHCTPQSRVDLLIEGRPYRLLLAFTSAKHFLLYVDALRKQSKAIEQVQTRIAVVDRGSWGELRFTEASES